MAKLALDNGVSDAAARRLAAAGHDIVYHAANEPDEWWFNAALAFGAEVFVSGDWDIVNMAENSGRNSVMLPQGVGGNEQAEFVLRKLKRQEER